MVVFDSLARGHAELVKAGELIEGDLENVALLERVFSRHSIDAVMHFAAFANVEESVRHPAKYYRNNVSGTLNLLQQMIQAGVKRFIFSSTCATYGVPQQDIITEDHLQNPINPYGSSKVMVEGILRDFDSSYGLKSVIFRYFNAAGADPDGEIGEWHEPETHLIPLVLDVAAGSRPLIQIYGTDYDTFDGTCIRDYIHVTDIAQAHLLGLQYLEAGNNSDVFNLGNGQGYSVVQIIDAVEGVTGRRVNSETTSRRPGDPPRLVGSCEKASRVLGWHTQFPRVETIVETAWKWHQRLQNLR